MPQNNSYFKKNETTTTALPTAEEIRHQYGDVMNYVKSLAARAKRVAERKGKKDQTKVIEEDLQVILTDLGQALTDDIHRVEADKKPFSHDDLKEIMKKRYSTFSDLASDYFGDGDDEEDGSDEPDEKDKPKAYLIIDGVTIATDDPTAPMQMVIAVQQGKTVQSISYDASGLPVINTLSEGLKDKKKPKKSDDPDDADTTTDDDDDSDDDSVKKLKIKFGGKKVNVPVITKTSGSGKNKKTRTYALAAEDGSEVFTSFAEANDYDDPVVWYELARTTAGFKADGSEVFSYKLATTSPDKLKYLG